MRRCGWLGYDKSEPFRIVWARGGQQLSTCPRSYVTPESISWLEGYRTAQLFGFGDVLRMAARDVDAYRLIEEETAREERNESR